jgi:hypothetical protein
MIKFILPILCATGLTLGAQTVTPPKPDGKLLHAGTDSLAIYLVRGTDTTRTGTAVDELRAIDEGGRVVWQRVYRSTDRLLGTRVDTLVDVQSTLMPVRHRGESTTGRDYLDFGADSVKGWVTRMSQRDSLVVAAPLPATVYNGSSFDLVLRAAPLSDTWQATVPAFLSNTRSVVSLPARVDGTEIVGGEPTWRVKADFAGLPVTFWIGKSSRSLRRQAMQIRPDVVILFAAPTPSAPPRSSS